MKVRFRRPMFVENPDWKNADYVKAKSKRIPYRVPRHILAPAGTIWDHPQMFILLRQGIADPVDEEAKEYVSHWDEETLREREEGYDKIEKGIATGDPFYDNDEEEEEYDDDSSECEIPDDAPLQELGD